METQVIDRADTELFTQCKMMRGQSCQVAWIPKKFATKDSYVKIQDEDGWKILEVWGTRPWADIKAASDRSHSGVFASLKKDK